MDIEPPSGGESVWDVMHENSGSFLAFGLSFVITLLYWRRHHRMFDGLMSFTPALLALNGVWLALVVFLQFPTEMLGRSEAPGTATLYLLTLAAITASGLAILWYLFRHPDLVEEDRLPSRSQALWAGITAVYMLLLALVGLWDSSVALFGLFGLFPSAGPRTRCSGGGSGRKFSSDRLRASRLVRGLSWMVANTWGAPGPGPTNEPEASVGDRGRRAGSYGRGGGRQRLRSRRADVASAER